MTSSTTRLLAVLLSLLLVGAVGAQDYTAQTADDPKIELTALQKAVKPLTKAEAEVEARAWMQLLAAKNKEIAAASDDQLLALTMEQTALVSRLTLVTTALTALGGDADEFDRYVTTSTSPRKTRIVAPRMKMSSRVR